LALPHLLAAGPAQGQTACDGRPIRRIHVFTGAVFGAEAGPVPAVARSVANSLHWRTRERTVRSELLFREGEPCQLVRLAESERLLRAQSYLRSARVVARPTDDGAVDVEVFTQDDWSLRGSARVEGGEEGPVRRLRLGHENFLGRGIRVNARYSNLGRRPGFEAGFLHHQLLGRHDLEVQGGSSSVGSIGEVSLLRPFEAEFDRSAWRLGARYRKEPFGLATSTIGTVAQPLVAFGADLGLARRYGVPGRLGILGAVLSAERLYVEGQPLAPDPANDSLAAAAIQGRYRERRRVRFHLLVGARSLRFTQRRGVDALSALEDVPQGVEAGLVLGRSLLGSGGLQRDWFVSAEAFHGAAYDYGLLAFARAKVEARYLRPAGRWSDVLASAEVVLYRGVGERSVAVLGLAGSGGWRTSTPFQLQLAGPNGIRGYGFSGLPVGRRVVLRGEHRYFAGTLFSALDVGTAAFADLGRGWRGDAAFGEDTGLLGALGGGLRVAFPSGSRVTYRLDLAVPLTRGYGLELRIGLRQQFGVLRGEPDDLTRSREQVSSVTVFNFPRF
jgi:hypothetical protein